MHLPLLHISNRRPDLPIDEDPLHLGQIEGKDWIPWLADPKSARKRALMRTRELDIICLSLAALGSEVTYFSLMGAVYSAVRRQTALSMAGTVLTSVALNQFVKMRFRFKRPPRRYMQRYAFVAPGDFTFPSGHAQNATALGFFVAQRSKSLPLKLAGLLFAISIPLSRVYLGVHYPRDVIAGSLLGLGSLTTVNLLEKPFREWWERSPRGARGYTVGLSALILGMLSGTPLSAFPLGIGGGLAAGHDISGRFRFGLDRIQGWRKWMHGFIGLTSIIGAGTIARPILKRESTTAAAIGGGMVGLSLTLGVPILSDLLLRYTTWRNSYSKKKKLKKK